MALTLRSGDTLTCLPSLALRYPPLPRNVEPVPLVEMCVSVCVCVCVCVCILIGSFKVAYIHRVQISFCSGSAHATNIKWGIHDAPLRDPSDASVHMIPQQLYTIGAFPMFATSLDGPGWYDMCMTLLGFHFKCW